MEVKEPRYRVFKLSIAIPFIHIIESSKAYKIDKWWQLILPAILYSFGTLLLGFWGWKGFKSLTVIHTNLTGGDDYSKLINETNYDNVTNFIWNNLTRQTSLKINKNGIILLSDTLERLINSDENILSDSSVLALKNELVRNGFYDISDSDIHDYLDSVQIYLNKEA